MNALIINEDGHNLKDVFRDRFQELGRQDIGFNAEVVRQEQVWRDAIKHLQGEGLQFPTGMRLIHPGQRLLLATPTKILDHDGTVNMTEDPLYRGPDSTYSRVLQRIVIPQLHQAEQFLINHGDGFAIRHLELQVGGGKVIDIERGFINWEEEWTRHGFHECVGNGAPEADCAQIARKVEEVYGLKVKLSLQEFIRLVKEEAPRHLAEVARSIPDVNGVAELISRAHAARMRLGVVSASPTDNVMTIMGGKNQLDLFEFVVADQRKKIPGQGFVTDAFDCGTERLGVRPFHTTSIGDTSSDYGGPAIREVPYVIARFEPDATLGRQLTKFIRDVNTVRISHPQTSNTQIFVITDYGLIDYVEFPQDAMAQYRSSAVVLPRNVAVPKSI